MDKAYGLIGCGMMGREHIKNVNLLDGAHIASLYDPVAAQVDAAQALAPDARSVDSVADMLTDTTLDALIIASPNDTHIGYLEDIAAQRALPVLCEKPLYTRAADKARIRRLQKSYPAPIWVAMEYRYMPPIAALIDRADAVTGGIKILSLQEHRFPFLEKVGDWNRFNARTGGTLVEKCCHFFDLMRLIIDAEPVSVFASAGQEVNHLDERYGGQTPDIWDCGYVVFDFASGARAMLELSMFAEGSHWQEEIHAVGPHGKIACRLPGPQRFWPKHLGPSPEPEISMYPRAPKNPVTQVIALDKALVDAGDHHGSTYYQHQKFLAMIHRGGTPEISLEDGIRAVDMGLAAQQSAVERQIIHL